MGFEETSPKKRKYPASVTTKYHLWTRHAQKLGLEEQKTSAVLVSKEQITDAAVHTPKTDRIGKSLPDLLSLYSPNSSDLHTQSQSHWRFWGVVKQETRVMNELMNLKRQNTTIMSIWTKISGKHLVESEPHRIKAIVKGQTQYLHGMLKKWIVSVCHSNHPKMTQITFCIQGTRAKGGNE